MRYAPSNTPFWTPNRGFNKQTNQINNKHLETVGFGIHFQNKHNTENGWFSYGILSFWYRYGAPDSIFVQCMQITLTDVTYDFCQICRQPGLEVWKEERPSYLCS